MRHVVVALLLTLGVASAASAQSFGTQGIEHYLRVEWEPANSASGPMLAGFVHNLYGIAADRIRLGIDTVDATGQVTSSTVGYVQGTAPPFGRAYFEIPVRQAGTYRVRVLSFEPVARGGL